MAGGNGAGSGYGGVGVLESGLFLLRNAPIPSNPNPIQSAWPGRAVEHRDMFNQSVPSHMHPALHYTILLLYEDIYSSRPTATPGSVKQADNPHSTPHNTVAKRRDQQTTVSIPNPTPEVKCVLGGIHSNRQNTLRPKFLDTLLWR